jgi:serine protease
MPIPRRVVPGGLALLLVLAACADSTVTPVTLDDAPAADLSRAAAPAIPSRSQERPGTLIDLPDAELWRHIEAAGGMAVIGLKAPGAVRGTYQGRLLLDRGQWGRGREAMLTARGITVLETDSLLPLLSVRLADAATLRAVRRHPQVDYVEPVRVRGDIDQWGSVGGCGWPDAWSGDRQTTARGDVYSARFTAMRIPEAWQVANGRGVTIGSIDTGIAATQRELREDFAGGENRWVRHYYLSSFSSADDACGHGTRMAGVIAAPHDGKGVIGVAWGANLVNVRHANGVANVSSSDARASVRAAGQAGSRIVSMAWQSMNWWWQVSDEIRWWHHNRGLLFLAAAGTSGCGDLIPDNNVVFPAEMGEVVAVTGISYPGGGMPCGIHYGSQVELTAFLDMPTTGRLPGEITSIGGSSNATGVVAGIAALAWQAHPTLTRDQLRQRLQRSGANFPTRNGREGFGLVDASRAVGP